MSNAETVETYLLRSEAPHEQVEESTWVVHPGSGNHRVVVKVQDPIVLFSTGILQVPEPPAGESGTYDQIASREALYKTLLELNAQLLHASYGLQGNQVVLSGAHERSHLDLNEFQAVLDDMAMALDTHLDTLARWGATSQEA